MNPYIDGSMLGDGTLEPHKEVSARLQIRHKIGQAAYNEWFMLQTPQLNWLAPTTVYSSARIGERQVTGYQHSIRSARLADLFPQRARWYPDGVKRVPSDLILTPTALAIWYMDDGSLGFSRIRGGIIAPLAVFYANGFTPSEVHQLRLQLLAEYGIKSSVGTNRGGPKLTVSGRIQVPALMEVISPIVRQVPSMGYKIDLSRMTERK